MVVKTVVDEDAGRKWEIRKHEENRYSVAYYEYFKQIGWRRYNMSRVPEYCDKATIEDWFGPVV